MRSATPKVLHTLAGRSMLGHAIIAARELEPQRLAVVVRHGRDAVAAHALEVDPGVMIADQDDVPGTGRAVQCALSVLDAAAHADAARSGESETQVTGTVVVIAGDTPLLDGASLAQLHDAHLADANAVTLLTTELDEPTGYGRIVREAGTGAVVAIVEEKDADAAQREIREVNASVYIFDAEVLRDALGRLGRDNAQGEVYLTDVIAIARADGGAVRAVRTDDPLTVEGVNDRVQLAVLRAELNRRIVEGWMREGVTVIDPATTWIDVDVELARDVLIPPGSQLHGATFVAQGAEIGPDTTLTDVEVGARASVVRTHGQSAVVGPDSSVGPFAYLRPGTRLGRNGKIGTFVETKNVTIGEGSKVPHLTYVGDATIGEGSNIGASSVFVNYDGVNKHHTTIGSHVRTGSDNTFVAPVSVGDGAYTGAGSVIRRDVLPGALAVSAGAQRTIEGWVLRSRAGTAAAEAATAALGAESNPLGAQARAERDRAQSGPSPTDHSEPAGPESNAATAKDEHA